MRSLESIERKLNRLRSKAWSKVGHLNHRKSRLRKAAYSRFVRYYKILPAYWAAGGIPF
jgi:hypothetical protein